MTNRLWIRLLMIMIPATLITSGFYLKSLEGQKAGEDGEEILVPLIMENLKHLHVQPKKLDDKYSKEAFDSYLEVLDYNKRFLLKEDVEDLGKYRLDIDDESKNGTYQLFDRSLEIINQRTDQAKAYYKEILAKPFDFTVDEEVEFGEDIEYAETTKDLKERWRKYLKYNVMTRLANYLDTQEEAIANNDTSYKVKPYDSLEYKARKNVMDQHDDWFERLEQLNRKDRLANYVNALTRVFDPHTNYFPPADKENFDIRMSGKLEGIGAQLQEKDGYIKVVKIIPGSPSFMQGDLKANDLILKVAQGKDEPVDIVGSRIDDAVKLIRGKKGSEVRLTVKKPDGSILVVPIVRDVVQLEETYAKSALLSDGNGKIGYIDLPTFYSDFKAFGKTSWRDVEMELKKLKKEGADALIFDLRNNGGGSLNDVVKMTGLFIKKGPIVQVQSRNREPEVYDDTDATELWDKPVVILVNEFSASASEIMAAALQDYGRALIVGSHKTHGKGSVQNFLDLNRTIRSSEVPDLGSLKITSQKFYRINGGTTQLKGVHPDIVLPDLYSYIETGESEQEYPLPYDKIDGLDYNEDHTGMSNAKLAMSNSKKRVKSSNIFNHIDKQAHIWEKRNEKEIYTLNLKKYRESQKKIKEENKEYDDVFKPIDEFNISFAASDEEMIASDTTKAKRYEDWAKTLSKDYYLFEALQISEDLAGVQNKPSVGKQ